LTDLLRRESVCGPAQGGLGLFQYLHRIAVTEQAQDSRDVGLCLFWRRRSRVRENGHRNLRIQDSGVRGQDVAVLVDVLVHVLVAVIDYPYPSGYGTAIGGTAERCVLF